MIDGKRVLAVCLALSMAGAVSFAAGIDTARDKVSGNPPASVAFDVLDQVSQGIIPPVPPVVGAYEAGGAPELTVPTLPDNAGSTALSVLDQISQGIIPPVPPVVGGSEPGGAPELTLPVLPDNAGSTAVSVLDQISQGILPPVPPVPDCSSAEASAGASYAVVVPEPATLSLLGLGGLLLARRRKK